MAAGLGRNGPLHAPAAISSASSASGCTTSVTMSTPTSSRPASPVRAVNERLGHANATTTLGIYAHAIPAADQRSADLLGDLLAPKEISPSKRKRSSNRRRQ